MLTIAVERTIKSPVQPWTQTLVGLFTKIHSFEMNEMKFGVFYASHQYGENYLQVRL